MSELRFDIPHYDNAMIHFIGEIMDGFFALDPLFSRMPRRTTVHSGPSRNVRGISPLDQNMPEIESIASLDMDAIRYTDIEALTNFFYELAQANIKAFSPEFFKGLTEITDATGQNFDAGGKPFSYDHFNDVIENMYIEFDEEGEPVLPTVVMHPKVFEKIKHLKPTPEQEQRHAEIIAKKKAEFNAKKRTRRLSQ